RSPGRTAAPLAGPAAAPPTTCAGSGGLNAGDPNDPLFCGEQETPPRAFYAEQWNNFCFVPSTQKATVTAGAPKAPQASGICATGAWKLGAQGQGTVIAVLDSGVDYTNPELVNQMYDPPPDPAFPDATHHGWNFYDDNSDPMDYFGHGTGRATLAAAQADNGKGIAGVAPRSKILAVKVGDTYVVHSENLAEGVVYAADHGADVINTSLGATGNSRLLRAAADYANSKGVFWAAATANEYSTHHNFPTAIDVVSGVGGLGPNLSADQAASCTIAASGAPSSCDPATAQTTFLQKVNYANFAGILDFATPIDTPSAELNNPGSGHTSYSLHASGTSTATPHLAGAGALVRSAGFVAGFCGGHADIGGTLAALGCDPASAPPALSADEVRQVLAYTATRVHNDDASSANNNYPPNPSGDPTLAGGEYYPEQGGDRNLGWNIWAGYGRPDLYAATAYAEHGLIPPEAQLFGDQPPPGAAYAGLQGPQPFGVYDPARTPSLPIVGHVAAPRLASGESFAWKVQVAPCLEPQEGDFSDVATGSAPKDGVLGTWTLPSSPGSQCSTGTAHPYNYPGTYTIRVLSTVTKDGAPGGGFDNPTYSGATDQDPNASLPKSAPLYGQDRMVVYVRPHGTADHATSPYYLGASGEGSPTLYDIEGRGELDLITATADGQVVALRPDGTPVPGWPVQIDDLSTLGPAPHPAAVNGTTPRAQIVSSVAVGDIDGDGQPEIVAAALKGGLYAWHRNGTRVAGFPVQVPPAPQDQAPPGTTHADYCASPHPAVLAQRYSDYGSIAAPVLADLEGNGKLDVILAGGNQCVYAVRPDGSLLWTVNPNATGAEPHKIASTPAVGDVNHDGHLDVVVGTEEVNGSLPNTSGRLYAYDGATHALLTGWPASLPSVSASGVPTVATGVISSPALFPSTAGNGQLQIADGVFLAGTDASHAVYTLNADGTKATTLQTDAVGGGSNFTDTPFLWAVAQTAVAKLGSSNLAVVTGGLSKQIATDTAIAPGKKTSFQHSLGAYDAANGAPLTTFPRQIEDWQFLSGPAIADVKGDGTQQVLEGSGGGFLHAFDPAAPPGAPNNLSTSLSRYGDGAEPAGFPVFTGGGYITSTPAVGQLTRGGKVAVATVTRDGWLFLTDTAGKPEANDQWWHFHHDERNTGLYGADTRPPATVSDLHAGNTATPGTVDVAWTEVGDDWWVGTPSSVALRWSTDPITDANFTSAHPVVTPAPQASGQGEHVTVSGLPADQRIYLAERSTDDAGNTSLIARTSVVTASPGNTGNSANSGNSGIPGLLGGENGGGSNAPGLGPNLPGPGPSSSPLGRLLALRLRGGRLSFSPRGFAGVPVVCLRPAARCRGSLALIASGITTSRTRTLARTSFSIAGGHRRVVW
ncbi:MAG: S8 family serine peptidase, partial [Actinomycetota bacterium]|nr:S8 family serine peptidase [Actinomycetota bacterium]